MAFDTLFVSITTSRLAVFAGVEHTNCLVIWDWKSAQVLFVRQPFSYFTNRFKQPSRSWKTSVISRQNSSMTIDYWQS